MKRHFSYFSAPVAMAAIAFSALATACGSDDFKIKGEIYGADDQPVVLAKSDFHGRWVAIDSTRTSSNGSFSISRPAPAAPEIFRVEVDGRFIYVPIDSTETVTVTSSLDKFGSEFTLTGSQKAEALERFEKEVLALPAGVSPDSLESFKRNIFTKYMRDGQGSIVSYYILTKFVGDKALFDPQKDYKYFAAVANGFKQLRPDDPRTALLEKTTLDAQKLRNKGKGNAIQIEAEEIKVIDIELPDENGKNRKLSELVGNGKPTVVIFSLLTHPDSPALNLELSRLYSSLGGNVNFYHISLDPDQYTWRDAAKNLPWVTVFDPDGEYSTAALKYNVSDLPTYFVYSAQGELQARAANINELRKQLR